MKFFRNFGIKDNSSTADFSFSLNSASSNDNGSMGKVDTNGNLSDAATDGNPPTARLFSTDCWQSLFSARSRCQIG